MPTVRTEAYVSDQNTHFDSCTVTNSTGSAITLTVYKESADGAVSALIVNEKSIGANSEGEPVYQILNDALSPGEKLDVLASASGLHFNVSGRDF